MILEFNIRDTVYLVTDPDQFPRIITGYIVREAGIIYFVAKGMEESTHYGFEISHDKNILTALT